MLFQDLSVSTAMTFRSADRPDNNSHLELAEFDAIDRDLRIYNEHWVWPSYQVCQQVIFELYRST